MLILAICKIAMRHLDSIQLYTNQSCIEPADFKLLDLLKDEQNLNVKMKKHLPCRLGTKHFGLNDKPTNNITQINLHWMSFISMSTHLLLYDAQ